ncbi:MAG: hypothetical protein O2976_04310, partial [Actinomycetota bacterium]|nr:hypothetical protein [Actinomycetota bacterium]
AGGAGGRDVRHREVLAHWPVLKEPWARDLEDHRTRVDESSIPQAPRAGLNAVDAGVTPLEAINRARGLPDDDGTHETSRRPVVG